MKHDARVWTILGLARAARGRVRLCVARDRGGG